MKVSIVTLGCRANQAESLGFEREILRAGHVLAAPEEEPDVSIINTCTVTARADQQSRQEINRVMKKGHKIIVTGCYAHLNTEKLRALDSRITVFTNEEKHLLTQSLGVSGISSEGMPLDISRSRPVIKIQDGCDFGCSYCIIPTARGRSRSVTSEEVVRDIQWYESQGKKEIVLSGIHLGSYGHDMTPRSSLAHLVEEILSSTRRIRIRLSSIEVNEIDDHLMSLLGEGRLCPHLHIPLQSGDDFILTRMNRHYDTSYYAAKLNALVKRYPLIAIGTDVMTGFPGEGEHEFRRTVDFIESMPFAYLHVFPYSLREGTAASTMGPDVSESEKKSRVMILKREADSKKAAYIERNVGLFLEVILEDLRENVFWGTSGNYLRVAVVTADDLRKGMLAKVRLTRAEDGCLLGIPINHREPSHN